MLTHMMPFYSYDVPHTCGPDPKVELEISIILYNFAFKYNLTHTVFIITKL